MRGTTLTLGLLAGLAIGSSAGATDTKHFIIDTAGDLGALCAATPGGPNFGPAIHMCHGYLVGVHHFHTALAAHYEQDIYCVEAAEPLPTRDQVAAAFAEWVATTPGASEKEALDAVLEWAAAVYPCQ